MLKRILAFVAIMVVLVALLLFNQHARGPLKVSGFIEADEIRLGSRVGGRVARVRAQEGESVSKGEVLVELEPYDLQARLAQAKSELAVRQSEFDKVNAGFRDEEKAQAKARLDQFSARLEKLESGPRKQELAAAEARLRLAKSQLELADIQHDRQKVLYNSKTIAQDEMDQSDNQLRVAQESVRVCEEELNQLLEGTRAEEIEEAKAHKEEARQAWLLMENGYRREDVSQAKAALEAVEAAADVIEAQIAELTIRAPVDGIVEAVDLQQGNLIAANAPVLSLMDTSRLWVRAYIPESLLMYKVGQKLSVSVDSYPELRFAGHISFIARQAEFTPGNVQTPEERSKKVLRIKVELEEGLDRLRPGMAADVWLEAP